MPSDITDPGRESSGKSQTQDEIRAAVDHFDLEKASDLADSDEEVRSTIDRYIEDKTTSAVNNIDQGEFKEAYEDLYNLGNVAALASEREISLNKYDPGDVMSGAELGINWIRETQDIF